jgi:uncharacterized protein
MPQEPEFTEWLYRLELVRPALLVQGPMPAEEKILEEHFAYLERLGEQGRLLLAGRTDTTGPETFGIVLFGAESKTAAEGIMNADPAVKKKLMRATLYPFTVAIMSPPAPPDDMPPHGGPPPR